MFAAGSGLIVGVILDKYGPGVTVLVSGLSILGGCFVFGLGWNYIAGYSLLAVGGMGVQFSAFRITYAFPGKESFIIGGISCLFDSSTAVFVVFEVLNR
jgi:hypothetical protein